MISHGPEWLLLDTDPCGGWCGTTLADYGSLETSTTKMQVDYVQVYQTNPLAWNSGAGGSGTWNSGNTNWKLTDGSGSSVAWSDQSDTYFRGADGTVTISGVTPTLRSLNFDSGNFTITGGSMTLATNIVNIGRRPDRNN